MDEGIFLKQDVILPARAYFPFLRLTRLIFGLHGLKWRKIHALNDRSPKKVLEILVSKPLEAKVSRLNSVMISLYQIMFSWILDRDVKKLQVITAASKLFPLFTAN